MISPKTEFEHFLIDHYFDGESIVATVRKFDFEHDLFMAFDRLKSFISDKEFDRIPLVIGAILVTINDKLRTVQDANAKVILEELARTTFEGQIIDLKKSEIGKKCLIKCAKVLKETCELKGYNYETLNKLLNLERMILIPFNQDDKRALGHCYYDWCSNDLDELDELASDLNKVVIDGVLNFKRLFRPIQDNKFTFKAYRSKLDELVVLFSVLKELELVKPRKISGHFTPLERYGTDNGKKLFDIKPHKVLERIKRNSKRYDALYTKMRETVESNCKESIERMEGQ
jgi:hypothetical protein